MAEMELFVLKVVVDRIEGRSVCGMQVGDYFELKNSSELKIPDGKRFCIYALQSVLPFLPAKQRYLADGDWLSNDMEFACPDPEERLIMRVERTNSVTLDSDLLT